MNRPTELIKELQEFNETMYGYEMCSSDCKDIYNYIIQLEKALDKVCELLSKSNVNDLCLLDMYVNGLDIQDKNVWKEWSLKESESK